MDAGRIGFGNIVLTPLYGFTGTVNLTVSSPPGLSCSLGFTALRLNEGTERVDLTCNGSTPGDFMVAIIATGGSSPKQTIVTVHAAPRTIFGVNHEIIFPTILTIVAIIAMVGAALGLIAVVAVAVAHRRKTT